jgi:antitoxin HigA-1
MFGGGAMHEKTLPRWVHPGEVLLNRYLFPLNISDRGLARAINVPPSRISQIVSGRHGMTMDTDIRLARYFGTPPGYWLQLQVQCEVMQAMVRMEETVAAITPFHESDGEQPAPGDSFFSL